MKQADEHFLDLVHGEGDALLVLDFGLVASVGRIVVALVLILVLVERDKHWVCHRGRLNKGLGLFLVCMLEFVHNLLAYPVVLGDAAEAFVHHSRELQAIGFPGLVQDRELRVVTFLILSLGVRRVVAQ